MKRLPLFVALLLSSVVASRAATRYVSTTGSDSANCGASETPCKTVQRALDLSVAGDVVRIRTGTYKECVTSPGGVQVMADAFVDATPLISFATVVLDGEGVCDRSGGEVVPHPVVTLHAGDQLKGVTVRNGGASGIAAFGPVTLIGNFVTRNEGDQGGGIYLDTSGAVAANLPTLLDQNILQANTADRDGGGMYVLALPSTPATGAPAADVLIRSNLVDGNVANGGTTGAAGGGIAVLLQGAGPVSGDRTVVITSNVVRNNVASNAAAFGAVGMGGGIFVATSVSGTGTETVLVGDDRDADTTSDANVVSLNTAGGYGGGIATLIRGTATAARQDVDVDSNTVGLNVAGLGGGGLYLEQAAAAASAGAVRSLRATGNTLNGNRSTGVEGETTAGVVKGGGGLCAESSAVQSPWGAGTFTVAGNTIRSNTSFSPGGGASLRLFATSAGGGVPVPASTTMEFGTNLLLGNAAANASVAGVSGGGLFVQTVPTGEATTTVTLDRLTVYDNNAEVGPGGIELLAAPADDGSGSIGVSSVTLTNSIVASNDGYGIGGDTLPDGVNVFLALAYVDLHGHATADVEPGLPDFIGSNGNISVDPELDAQGAPKTCSPTIDAGDPAAAADVLALEPQPNGGRLNLGHLAGTSAAVRTFPDVNADGRVNGLDVLSLAAAFNSVTTSGWYNAAADRDLDGDVDGDDLSYVAAFYGQDLSVICP